MVLLSVILKFLVLDVIGVYASRRPGRRGPSKQQNSEDNCKGHSFIDRDNRFIEDTGIYILNAYIIGCGTYLEKEIDEIVTKDFGFAAKIEDVDMVLNFHDYFHVINYQKFINTIDETVSGWSIGKLVSSKQKNILTLINTLCHMKQTKWDQTRCWHIIIHID